MPRFLHLVMSLPVVWASLSFASKGSTIFSNVPVSAIGPSFCLPCDEDAVAVEFSPTQNLYLNQVSVAITNIEFTNAAVISVLNDNGGMPGAETLESWTVTNLPNHAATWPNPPLTTVTDIYNLYLTANTNYWVMVSAVGNSYNAWATGSSIYTTTEVRAGGLWQGVGPYTPAMVVTGSTTPAAAPEPGTIALCGIAFALVFVGRLRTRRTTL